MQLHPRAAAAGVRLFAHDVLDSTNTEALRRARAGDSGPFWVTSRRQTAGRGRRGRDWISEPGNLYASMLLDAPSPPHCAPQLSVVAALAAHDAIRDVTRLDVRLKLKWPNDLLCDGAKVGGILVEGEGTFVVMGIGVNCSQHPDHTRYPASDLSACGAAASPEAVFEQLSARVLDRLTQWNHAVHFASIRADWLARAFRLGEQFVVSTGERELAGVFESLDETGRLVLRQADGQRELITAGEILAAPSSINMPAGPQSVSGPLPSAACQTLKAFTDA